MGKSLPHKPSTLLPTPLTSYMMLGWRVALSIGLLAVAVLIQTH